MMMIRSRVTEVLEIEWERERALREDNDAADDLHDPAVLSWRETIERSKAATELILHS